MRIGDAIRFQVHVTGRGEVRLWDLLRELGVPDNAVPRRIYHRDHGTVVVCSAGPTRPYDAITLDLGHRLLAPYRAEFRPQIISTEPIRYVTTFGPLFEYEPGKLFPWSKRRKNRKPAFGMTRGELLFEVSGEPNATALRVRLPHRRDQTWMLMGGWIWLDRPPTELELRLRQLKVDNPWQGDWRHPLFTADWLLEYAFKERWTLTADGSRINGLAIERWDGELQHEGLGVDEAIVALMNGILTEDRTDWCLEDLVQRYVAAEWRGDAGDDELRQMTQIGLIEGRMIRASMRTVTQARSYVDRTPSERRQSG